MCFRWTFVTSSDPAAAVDTRGLKELTPEALLAKVKGIINERGHNGIRGLGVSFRIMDDRRAGKLGRFVVTTWGLRSVAVARPVRLKTAMRCVVWLFPREEFKWGLYDYGVHLTDEEFDMILNHFDRNGDGFIDFTEFLVTLRGEINERRLVFIREVGVCSNSLLQSVHFVCVVVILDVRCVWTGFPST